MRNTRYNTEQTDMRHHSSRSSMNSASPMISCFESAKGSPVNFQPHLTLWGGASARFSRIGHREDRNDSLFDVQRYFQSIALRTAASITRQPTKVFDIRSPVRGIEIQQGENPIIGHFKARPRTTLDFPLMAA
jgi:hypothetical protein